MNESKSLSYAVGILFLIYFITILRTPLGDRIVSYGYLIALGSLALMVLLTVFRSDIQIPHHSVPILVVVSALFLFSILSTVWSQYPQLSLQRTLMSFLGISAALIICLTDRNKKYTFNILSVLIFSLVTLLSVSGVLVYAIGYNTTINGTGVQVLTIGSVDVIQNTMGPENRISSPLLENPNTLAGLIAISLPLSIHLLARIKSFVVVFGIIVQFIALILTFSRTGLVVTLTGIVLLTILFLHQRSKLNLVIRAGFLISVPSLLLINYIPGIDRLTSLSFTVREITWAALYESFTQNPVTGTGFGVSNEAVLFVTENTATSAHSDYFAVLAELGVVGFVLFLFLLIFSTLIGLKNYINSDPSEKLYLAVAMAIFVSLSVRGLTETVMIRPGFIQLFWAYALGYMLSSNPTKIIRGNTPLDENATLFKKLN